MAVATAADWTPLVERYLHPFSALTSDDVDSTQAWALNATFTRVRSAAELLRLTGMCDCRGGRAGRANAKPCLRETRGEKCTLWPPRGGGTCFDTRCCVGWDCALSPLGCR